MKASTVRTAGLVAAAVVIPGGLLALGVWLVRKYRGRPLPFLAPGAGDAAGGTALPAGRKT